MIDVIIPAYNCENTLETTVKSIEKSGLSEFDIIIVDDGSKDNTKAVCEKLCAEFKNINCVFKKNGGVSSARNEGLRYAKGEYVLFFDSDDTVDEGGFSGAEALLSEKKPDMLVFGMMFDFYKNGKLYRTENLVYEKEGLFSKDELLENFAAFYTSNSITPIWNKFIKRSIINDDNIEFDEKMIILEDFLFSLKLLEFSKTVYCLKKPIYRYRQSENEMNAFLRLKKTDDIALYLEPVKKQIKELSPTDGEKTMASVYFMLLYQKLYNSNLKEIKNENESFLKSEYANDGVRELLGERDKKLFDRLKEHDEWVIYLDNKKTQLRHKVAVFVKSVLGGKLK